MDEFDLPETKSAASGGEIQFHRLLEVLPTAAYTCNVYGYFTYFNERAIWLWGRIPSLNDPRDRYCGSFRLLSAEGVPLEHNESPTARVLDRDRSYYDQELIFERPDGTRRKVVCCGNPFHDDCGRLIGAVTVLMDVTEQRRAEEAEHRLAAIVESCDDAIIGKTLEGVITSWNHGAEALYGYTEREMIGQPVARLVPADRPDELPDIMRQLRAGKHIRRFETLRRCKDGTLRAVSLTLSPIKDARGRIIGASTIARALTERIPVERSPMRGRAAV